MSAGGITYSGLNNYGKSTLPSVESWGTNMNILRDPPKSITTRRIDKVGENSFITDMIDDSSDRNCEAINVYARGVNPFVSVSYSNVGNNGGQRSNSLTSNVTQASLPYKIMKDGAFRPPEYSQYNLTPLSRLPRVWTKVNTNRGFIDYRKKLKDCGTSENTKEVKTNTLKASIRPTAVYKIEKPIEEPFEIKYVIKPVINNSATSGIRSMNITRQDVKVPTKEIDNNKLNVFANANLSDNLKYVNKNNMETDRFIQDTNYQNVVTNPYSNKNVTNIEDVLDLKNVKVKNELLNVKYKTQLSGNDKVEYIHNDIQLNRNLPEYTQITNKNKNIYKNIKKENEIVLNKNTPLTSFEVNRSQNRNTEFINTEYKLSEKINPGSFNIPGQKPVFERTQNFNTNLVNEKSKMEKNVSHQYQDRFLN